MKKDTEQRYPLPSAFRKHFVVDMASNKTSKEKKGIETDYRTPGLRSAQTTTLFRAVNPELFVKPTIDGIWTDYHHLVCRLSGLPTCYERKQPAALRGHRQ
ncbi:small integral membrane protein 8 isoform X3 [Vanacampus margaritifer]